jgi:hypothetical protein
MLVIINTFCIMYTIVSPDKAQAPLVVDANAVLAFPMACQCLQTVTRRHTQSFQSNRLYTVERQTVSYRGKG